MSSSFTADVAPLPRRRAGGAAVVVVGLAVVAWVALAAWGASPDARYLDHRQLAHGANATSMAALAAGWLLMITAMMLPTTTPLVSLFQRLVANRPGARRLVALLITGFVGVWMVAGMFFERGDALLHSQVDLHPWLARHSWLIGSAVFAIAGLYQFSSFKYVCLDRCRMPLSFIRRRWRGGNRAYEALRIGIDHGVFCLGCCWALMLLMFSIGMSNLGWMFALAFVMAAEKTTRIGRRPSQLAGVVLIAVGAGLLAMHA